MEEAQDLTEKVEHAIHEIQPGVDVIVHAEPPQRQTIRVNHLAETHLLSDVSSD